MRLVCVPVLYLWALKMGNPCACAGVFVLNEMPGHTRIQVVKRFKRSQNMADNKELPNGFTGFAFRKQPGTESAADAIREREAQRAAHAATPQAAPAPRRGAASYLTEREAAADAANEVRGAFQYNRHEARRIRPRETGYHP